ncbi:enoyl-CoA hydratase [Perkinsela sp. CCAP 1560/4]|nr:enoyl-CoA hydratase [Perkinsela sp. CCAP 1560/4]|eukprot:KNH01781.1 enoyl-CoA hydratase [Perkinsela sp. CCAP 1560/4]
MSYRKYNVVDDWYRYGKTRASSYKGQCGVKFYGGLYGNRKAWSLKFSKLSFQVKDFIAHGAFNIVNPQWKNIHNYFFLKQASAFPSALRVYLYEVRKKSDLIKDPQEKNSQSVSNQFSDFENFLVSLTLGRSDTHFFIYAKQERKLYRVVLQQEKLKNLYGKRQLKKFVLLRSSLAKQDKDNPLLPRVRDYFASAISVIEDKGEILNSSHAVEETYRCLQRIKEHGDVSYSANALKLYLDPKTTSYCMPVLKWHVRNNDPRSNVSSLKEPFGEESIEKRFLSIFLYISQDKITEGLQRFFKKRLGFCAVNGMKKASNNSKCSSLGIESSNDFQLSAIKNMQASVDHLSLAK